MAEQTKILSEANAQPTADAIFASLGLDADLDNDGVNAEESTVATEEGDAEDGELTEDGAGVGGDNADDEGTDDESDEESAEDEEGSEDEGVESEDEDAEGDDESPDGEESEDGSDDESEEVLPKSVAKLQKRVGKLTKTLRETQESQRMLSEENEGLKGKLDEAGRVVLTPSPENPLVDVTSEKEVQNRVSQMKQVKRWCQANPEGGEVAGPNGPMTLTAEQVRERLLYAEDVIEAAPQRVMFLQEEAKFDGYVRKKYPALFQSSSDDRKRMDTFVRQNPEILKLTNWKLIIGDAIRGGRIREQEEREAAKPTKVKPRAKAPAVKPSKAPVTSSRQAGATKATNRFLETGASNDLVGLIEAGGF